MKPADLTKLSKHGRRGAPEPVELSSTIDGLVVKDRNEQSTTCLKDLWRPCAAFLVGAGPSLNNIPPEAFHQRGILSLAINNTAGHIHPRAFVCSDPPEKFHGGIFLDGSIMKFVPNNKMAKRVRMKEEGQFYWTKFRLRDCPNVWGFDRACWWSPEHFFARPMACWGINSEVSERQKKPKCIFTFFLGFRLLHYLGVRRVYLVGVDFAMAISERQVGNYAFPEGGHGTGNNDHYRAGVKLCAELAPVFADHGFEVYNTNPKSRLTVWPYVPFEEAFRDCRGLLPREPFDLEHWYLKPGELDG